MVFVRHELFHLNVDSMFEIINGFSLYFYVLPFDLDCHSPPPGCESRLEAHELSRQRRYLGHIKIQFFAL